MKPSSFWARTLAALLSNLKPADPSRPVDFRRWTLILLGIVLGILAVVAGTVVLVDPLMQYRKPLFGLQSVMWNDDYLNPGMARNYDFDAVIIGGSFVQNTKVSEVDALFGYKTVKMTNSGGSVPRMNELLKLALDSGPKRRAVFVSVPPSKFSPAPDRTTPFDGPAYLYDQTPFNDIGYWLNIDVVGHLGTLAVKGLKGTLKPQSDQAWLDQAYSWFPEFKNRFSKKAILKHYSAPKPRAMKPIDATLAFAQANFNFGIRPHIEAHPETTFYFFFPPHSRLLWRDNLVGGVLLSHWGNIQWLTAELLKYPNVKVFNFMDFDPFSSDLNNYKDRSHYSPVANTRMFEAMAHDEYRVLAAPTQAEIDAFLDWAKSYEDPDIPTYRDGQADQGTEEDVMAAHQGVEF